MVSDAGMGTVTVYLAARTDDTLGGVTQIPAKAKEDCSVTFKLVNGYAFDLKPSKAAKCDPRDVVSAYGERKFCQSCPNGLVKSSKAGGCVACPKGYYYEEATATVDSVCKPCRAGYYCEDGISEVPCQLGSYSSRPKQPACKQCPANTYNVGDGYKTLNTKCFACPKGTVAPVGASVCGVAFEKSFAA
jgi:hypothetical protein